MKAIWARIKKWFVMDFEDTGYPAEGFDCNRGNREECENMIKTFDEMRLVVAKYEIARLKAKIEEWELVIEEITGISEDIPNIALAREMLEKAERGEIACSDK